MDTNSDVSDTVEKILSGEIKFYKLEETLGYAKAAKVRLEAMRKKTGHQLKHISSYSIDPENCRPNIENMFGAIQIPLGFAGPVIVKGSHAQGEFFLPLATTEGSLVASINRGASAISAAGGAEVHVFDNAQTRSLLFQVDSLAKAKEFSQWVENNFTKIKELAEQNSKFLKLEKAETFIVGTNIWLRLRAFTGDAMGMNMITIAGDTIGRYLDKMEGIKFLSASGNICADKKASAINMICGRGKKVVAEVRVPDSLCRKYFKTSASALAKLNYLKNHLGSALSGSYGFNAHFANVISAIFTATGQDPGHVVEGSIGFTQAEAHDDNLVVSVTLPCLQVGTLGGGTRVETQKECLELMGVYGAGNPPGTNALKLAEITGVAVLAGELSLLGALSAHDLVSAHQRFNR